MLRSWLEKRYDPMPISVNVSRVSVYNPKLVEVISDLVELRSTPAGIISTGIDGECLYIQSRHREAMKDLQKRGFTILMDDFGSGYSSLNVLKDIVVDVLKIDMKFMSDTEIPAEVRIYWLL